MTTIVFAVLAAALIVLVFLVLACLHEEHRYPHPDQEASGGPEFSRLDRFDGLMISAESLAFVVAKQRECSALEVAESLHYAAVDMFLGKGNPDDND